MQLEQTFDVPAGAERVWRRFADIESLVLCLPGASLRAPPEAGRLQLSMVVKLGPMIAAFAGDGEVTLDDIAKRGTVTGSGTDRKSGSRIKGQVTFAVSELTGATPSSTRVTLTIDYTMAGALAQFSRGGIVRDLAQSLTTEFATNLRARLQGDGVAETAQTAGIGEGAVFDPLAPVTDRRFAESPSPAPAATVGRSSATPLSLGALLWTVVVNRIRRWFRRRTK